MSQIIVNDIVVEVIRKKMKSLRLAVFPASGKVRVSVPNKINEEQIRDFILDKLEWIKKHKARVVNCIPRPEYKYITGEKHYFLGSPHSLDVVVGSTKRKVIHRDDFVIVLHADEHSDITERQAIIKKWYKDQLNELVKHLIEKWQKIIGVEAASYRIKQMKSRWGSCNIYARCITVNLDLAKRPIHCLEYIIVHELVHLHERYHNARFYAFMDQFLPKWRDCRDELNKAHWSY